MAFNVYLAFVCCRVLRQVLVNVKEVVSQKWPKDPLVGLRAIRYVFLYLCAPELKGHVLSLVLSCSFDSFA